MSNILKYDKYKKINENIDRSDLVFTSILIDKMDDFFLPNSEFALKKHLNLDNNTNFDIIDTKFVVNWEFNLDVRNWGVKNLSIDIKKVHGIFTVNVWSEEGEDIPFVVDFDSELADFIIINNIQLKETIIPSSIEINFKEKSVTIN